MLGSGLALPPIPGEGGGSHQGKVVQLMVPGEVQYGWRLV